MSPPGRGDHIAATVGWERLEAVVRGLRVHGYVFQAMLDGDDLVLHLIDPSHPSGLRSWRFRDGEDVTEEEQ